MSLAKRVLKHFGSVPFDIHFHLLRFGMTGPPKWPKIYPKYRTSGGMTGCLGSETWHGKQQSDFLELENQHYCNG